MYLPVSTGKKGTLRRRFVRMFNKTASVVFYFKSSSCPQLMMLRTSTLGIKPWRRPNDTRFYLSQRKTSHQYYEWEKSKTIYLQLVSLDDFGKSHGNVWVETRLNVFVREDIRNWQDCKKDQRCSDRFRKIRSHPLSDSCSRQKMFCEEDSSIPSEKGTKWFP